MNRREFLKAGAVAVLAAMTSKFTAQAEEETMPDPKMNPEIEDVIREKLTGDAQKNALDFTSFLRANGFSLDEDKKWSIACGDKTVGYVHVALPGFDLIVNFAACDFNGGGAVDDDLKEFAWAHVTVCPKGCGGTMSCDRSEIRNTIFGKEFERTCTCPLQFFNPDAKAFEKINKLLLMLK